MRALNAAKMERMFSKPFVGSLDGHVDAVEVLSRKPQSLSIVASASWDGGEMCNKHIFLPLSDSVFLKVSLCMMFRNEVAF